MRRIPLFLAAATLGCLSCSTSVKPDTLQVNNLTDVSVTDVTLSLDPARLPAVDWASHAFFDGDRALPFQIHDQNSNGQADEIFLLVDLEANQSLNVEIKPVETMPLFPKRTQAELSHKVGGTWEGREYEGGEFQNVSELRVPAEHTDHSWYIRYEGPGWESDKVGYRFYLDWRNATDIFGKTTTEMVLQDVGQDGFDSYHELSDWGMDVLKVGESLGLGTFATWQDGKAERVAVTDSVYCAITANGPVQSMIHTTYYGWEASGKKQNLESDLSIAAGSRLTRHHLQWEESLDSVCTGIVTLDNTELLTSTEGAWGYLATWGKQSLNDDQLGMAVLFKTADLLEITTDEHSQVVVLRPSPDNSLTYYFLGAWEKEPEGITNKADFEAYLKAEVQKLAQPLKIDYNK